MSRMGAARIAFRVGGFGALGFVVSELLNGHGGDRSHLILSTIEVWAIATVAWFLVEAGRPRR